ncbi:hypothetical protein GCM10010346_22110 [Streptomyces chryseus]|uniref:Uncharacterized protein n=1 Tax=Streptomyces chryseus TaxID=68186 RepID=A0ABQ3DIK8_9ACTN|nr:hypothetical protein GCM10010346_22110 [Streptomyces chryseus]
MTRASSARAGSRLRQKGGAAGRAPAGRLGRGSTGADTGEGGIGGRVSMRAKLSGSAVRIETGHTEPGPCRRNDAARKWLDGA